MQNDVLAASSDQPVDPAENWPIHIMLKILFILNATYPNGRTLAFGHKLNQFISLQVLTKQQKVEKWSEHSSSNEKIIDTNDWRWTEPFLALDKSEHYKSILDWTRALNFELL